MTDTPSRAATLDLVGERLCLNFTNTSSGRGSDHRIEHLTSYEMLLAWSRHAGVLDDDTAAELEHLAARRPDEAARVLRDAIDLREAMHRVFAAVARSEAAADEDIAVINAALARALSRLRVRSRAGGHEWFWDTGDRSLDRMLWPIARSAAEVLTQDAPSRLRQCPGRHCGWLFYDTTKNGRRRWCEMRVCGNRSKARRSYERRKAAKQPSEPQ